eukprot:1548078-Pyramimonas_sp.AAC.2
MSPRQQHNGLSCHVTTRASNEVTGAIGGVVEFRGFEVSRFRGSRFRGLHGELARAPIRDLSHLVVLVGVAEHLRRRAN